MACCAALLAYGLACGSTVAAAEFGASWTGDFAGVLDGGLREGQRHLGLVEVTFDHAFALGKTREATLHGSAQHVYGGGFSERWVGDLQTVSNVDADTATRLYEAWVDVPLTDATSLKVGRYDLNSEFDVIEAGGLFLSSSQGIGPDISQTGAAGPSIFPRTALAVRFQFQPGEGHLVRVAALDVESDPDGKYTDTPFTGGTMLILEYERPGDATTWKAGTWSFTRTRSALDERERDREFGAYGSVEHRIGDRWSVYARVGAANEEVSRLAHYVGGGLVDHEGLLPRREDALGIAVAHARNGAPYRDLMSQAGEVTTAAETVLELTWRVPMGRHVVLQPDLQYVIDPDTNPAIDDALVFILRVEASF